MIIKKIKIENYRGIKTLQEIPLSNFTSVVGRNDSGKSIILNAIASFLDIKEYPIGDSDFNNTTKSIFIECHFCDTSLKDLLESKIKSKLKKSDGLDEFLSDILFDNTLIIQKITSVAGKTFQIENILIKDFDNIDFSMLYNKSDIDLNGILEKYNIEIPVQGKGRNSKLEKIKSIKDFCFKKQIPLVIKPISDEYKISSLLPAVELFVSDYGLKADTTFKTTSVSEIQSYFLRETESKEETKLQQVEKEIQKEMSIEAQAIKNYMIEYSSSLEKLEIVPNIVWKDSIKSVDVNFQFKGDPRPFPMSHKGTGYRRLFMVARFRYLAEKNNGNNIIYLIEEPETYLHPSAQEDLLNAMKDLSAENQIIITTHSPVYAGSTSYNSVILCKKDSESVYEFADEMNKNIFIQNIVEELGIKPSYNLRDTHEKIVFVEGKNDAIFYDIICKKILNVDLLGNEKILVLPFGGGEDIESFVNIDYFDNSQRELYLIIDSDKDKNNEIKQMNRVTTFNNKNKGKGYMIKKSCIENYYHPRAFERVYSLQSNTFDFFSDNEKAKEKIKDIILTKNLKNIKEKNNLKVFYETTIQEWNEILENELINFLSEITKLK